MIKEQAINKNKKRIWITFIILIFVNISLPIIGFLLKDIINSPLWEYPLLLPPAIQFGGLIYLADIIGLKVFTGSGYIPSPTFLGFILLIVPILVTLIIHYKLACYIAKRRMNKMV